MTPPAPRQLDLLKAFLWILGASVLVCIFAATSNLLALVLAVGDGLFGAVQWERYWQERERYLSWRAGFKKPDPDPKEDENGPAAT